MKPNIETDAFLSHEIDTERTWLKRKLREFFNCVWMLSFTKCSFQISGGLKRYERDFYFEECFDPCWSRCPTTMNSCINRPSPSRIKRHDLLLQSHTSHRFLVRKCPTTYYRMLFRNFRPKLAFYLAWLSNIVWRSIWGGGGLLISRNLHGVRIPCNFPT